MNTTPDTTPLAVVVPHPNFRPIIVSGTQGIGDEDTYVPTAADRATVRGFILGL